MRLRLDQLLVQRGLAATRSQAGSSIKLGDVSVEGMVTTKPGLFVSSEARVALRRRERYVSRAGLKLAGVAASLGLDFTGTCVLDVGSSTGGFTDFALQHGAARVIAVDVGTHQLHPALRADARIELHEKTDIRRLAPPAALPDIVLIDVSFISLRGVLPHIFTRLAGPGTLVVAMVKPQFEAGRAEVNKGIIKNDTIRRQILKDFELWVRRYARVSAKADSDIAGAKGNRERFYLLTKTTAA